MCAPETELTQQLLATKRATGDTTTQPDATTKNTKRKRRPSDSDYQKSKRHHLDTRPCGHEIQQNENMQQIQRKVTTAGADLFCGVQTTRSRDKTITKQIHLDESVDLNAIKTERDTLTAQNTPAATSEAIDKPSSMSLLDHPKRPCEDHSFTSPFLSARKRKTEASQAIRDSAVSKFATGIRLTKPFTYLTVAVGVVCGIEIWDNENEDMILEDPLEFQDPPQIVYKPVYTEDGFIVTRSKPKLLVGYLHAFQLCMGPNDVYIVQCGS